MNIFKYYHSINIDPQIPRFSFKEFLDFYTAHPLRIHFKLPHTGSPDSIFSYYDNLLECKNYGFIYPYREYLKFLHFRKHYLATKRQKARDEFLALLEDEQD